MATLIDLEPVLVVRELGNGAVYAHPLGDPSLAVRTTSRESALEEQERFLTEYLAKAPAWQLAEFTQPEGAHILEVAAVVTRGDLPRRIQVTSPITVPCVVVPHRRNFWVHVLPLGTFTFLESEQNLERVVREEIEKAARARDLSSEEFLAMLPASRHELARIKLRVERKDASDSGERSEQRRKKAKERERAAANKLLDEVGTKLREEIRSGRHAPVLGRTHEVDALQSLLGGSERLSAVLVGRELSGKSSVVRCLIARALKAGPRDPLQTRRIVATSGAQLVAGQSGFGQLEERIDQVMQAAEQLDAIVYFDDLGDLLSGRPGTIEDMVSGMLPYITADRVRVIGELTPEQLSHYEKLHVGFFAALSRITIDPLDKAMTREILEARVAHTAKREPHRPQLKRAAIGPLLDLCDRYLAYEAFPGKAVRLHDELRAVHEADVADDGSPKAIGPSEVYRAFSTRSGIPLFLLREDRAMKFDQVQSFFASRVIGQHDAVERLAQTLCMVKANLQPPAKPLSNFLFIGPTGVGKTEVAKTLALFLFGSADRMVRFDMSEYTDPLAAERLIRGSQRDEGELTKRVRQQPFCVVLLDEIEKAHPAVFDLLLQVCGEGRLSDARGRTTYFHNAIIIMTSNLGAAHRRPDAGFGGRGDESGEAAMARYYLEQVDRHFRPEFVNRIDRVIPFAALGRDEIAAVAEVAMRRIEERDGLLGRGAMLSVSPAALRALAEDGYSPEYGARALRRHLENALVSPLSALVSEHAADFDAATVAVRLADEPAPAPAEERTTLVDHTFGRFAAHLSRPAARGARATNQELSVIAGLRRVADRCMGSATIEELRERIDYLVADLAGISRTKTAGKHASNAGALAAELGRLNELHGAAMEHRNDIASAEDLAMAAQLEGVSAELFINEAEQSFARFERAFVRMAAGYTGKDSIGFFARGIESPKALRKFLLPFLQEAKHRNWQVTVHRVPEVEPSNWPADCPYGEPRTLPWCLKELEEASEAQVLRSWRGALVLVRGAGVGGLLVPELGIWRFQSAEDRAYNLELTHMTDLAELSSKQLSATQLRPPPVKKASEIGRSVAKRCWHDEGRLSLPGAGMSFELPAFADVFANLERIQFGLVAARALADVLGNEEGV